MLMFTSVSQILQVLNTLRNINESNVSIAIYIRNNCLAPWFCIGRGILICDNLIGLYILLCNSTISLVYLWSNCESIYKYEGELQAVIRSKLRFGYENIGILFYYIVSLSNLISFYFYLQLFFCWKRWRNFDCCCWLHRYFSTIIYIYFTGWDCIWLLWPLLSSGTFSFKSWSFVCHHKLFAVKGLCIDK